MRGRGDITYSGHRTEPPTPKRRAIISALSLLPPFDHDGGLGIQVSPPRTSHRSRAPPGHPAGIDFQAVVCNDSALQGKNNKQATAMARPAASGHHLLAAGYVPGPIPRAFRVPPRSSSHRPDGPRPRRAQRGMATPRGDITRRWSSDSVGHSPPCRSPLG